MMNDLSQIRNRFISTRALIWCLPTYLAVCASQQRFRSPPPLIYALFPYGHMRIAIFLERAKGVSVHNNLLLTRTLACALTWLFQCFFLPPTRILN